MPGLLDFNPASHLVWLAGGLMLGLLALFLLLDAGAWLSERLAERGSRSNREHP